MKSLFKHFGILGSDSSAAESGHACWCSLGRGLDAARTWSHRMTAVAKLPEISTFIEQMDMLRDDFVKYQDGNKSVPFVVLRDALVAALNAYDDARASLSPAELGDPVTADNAKAADSAALAMIGMGYAWDGVHWYQATPRAAEAVSEEVFAIVRPYLQPEAREKVRAALTAALTPGVMTAVSEMTCRLCGKPAHKIGGYLQRVNEKGVPGIWECRPNCEADLPNDVALLLAIEGDSP